MLHYEEFVLGNGLRVIIHEDSTLPIVAFNLLYQVGSRNEFPTKTGFAHLFEHLMFGGSKHIPVYDEYLQKVGGENNAFTTPDFTNYYITLPAINLETAFWLESDRMFGLSFDPKVLEVQRKVVIEEFKQRYLNQPYGDVWLKLRPLAYQQHPYRWPTIGKDISHIENATLDDVREFFSTHYVPDNAILAVAGNVTRNQVEDQAEKWFGPIPGRFSKNGSIPAEPGQQKKRTLEVQGDVPSDAIYMAWHMGRRMDDDYHATDLLCDMIGRGKASRLYQELVKKEKIFNTIHAYVSGSVDPGLFIIEGKVREGIRLEEAEAAILNLIGEFKEGSLETSELEKVKTQAETSLAFSEVEVLNRAMNLAFFANLGDPELYNQEMDKVSAVTEEKIMESARKVLDDNNSNVLYYKSQQ
ncbi:MAG: insulinase family protein [Cyclobacteriaceae bacterium]|nr:insulinase family protein [Cyclobacteriaceae bacterium]